MRTPDNTYTTLCDRAEHLIRIELDNINAYYSEFLTAKDVHLKERKWEDFQYHTTRVHAMIELFNCTFRDYTAYIEYDELSDRYHLGITAR